MMAGAVIGAVVGAIVGGLTMGLCQLLIKDKKKAKSVGTITMVIAIVISMQLVNLPQVQKIIGPLFNKDIAYITEMDEKLITMLSTEEYRKEASDMTPTTRQNFVVRGLERLTDKNVMLWNNSRLQMANDSKEICAGFWNGDMSKVDIIAIIKGLGVTGLEQWLIVSSASLEAELAEAPIQTPDKNKIASVMESFNATFSEAEKEKARTVFANGVKAVPENGCWLVKSMMVYADQNPEQGVQIVKLLAAAAAKAGK